jgi:uncharacterized membrane protein (UPF0127 family)
MNSKQVKSQVKSEKLKVKSGKSKTLLTPFTLHSSLFTFVFLLVFNAGFAACSPQKQKTTVLRIERENAAAVEITVELARTDEERAQGLMFRKTLPDGQGMLFVFDRDQQLSFWMKNTVIPLSIAFIASDGHILEIKDMQPNDLNSVKSSRSVRYALEVPQGWFDRVNVKAGDVVQLTINN